jgi:biopolymer transport protein ExbD
MSRPRSPFGRNAATKRSIVLKPAREAAAEINVTPLIDVVLVLLIIFMVMTPVVERDLAIQLSTEKRTDKPAEVAATQVLVSVEGNGGMRINAQPVAAEEYVNKLKDVLKGRAPEDQVVFVVAGDAANYGNLVEAIDRAKLAGATMVGLATDAQN